VYHKLWSLFWHSHLSTTNGISFYSLFLIYYNISCEDTSSLALFPIFRELVIRPITFSNPINTLRCLSIVQHIKRTLLYVLSYSKLLVL
jgi:hypothetical protein